MDDAKVPIRDDLVCFEAGLENLASPALDPLFWPAERLGVFSAWWPHVPFAHWIVAATEPRVLVELGTYTGVSYAAFCQAVAHRRLATRCHSVDTWRGDPHTGEYGEEVFEEFRHFHDERYASFSTLLRCTFNEALSYFDNDTIDLLHIDGTHTYDAARQDFENWLPKLSDRAVVLFHDTNERRDDFGVWRLWAEFRKRYAGFEFLHGHGLGVLAIGADVPPAIAHLTALEGQTVAVLRERFRQLGEQWSHVTFDRIRTRELEQQVSASAAAIADATARAEKLETEARALVEEARARASQATARADRAEAEVAKARMLVQTERARFRATISRTGSRTIYQADQSAIEQKNAEIASLTARAIQAEEYLNAVYYSTSWRLSAPLRYIGSRFPIVARYMRRSAKLAWWCVTLQLYKRYRARRGLHSQHSKTKVRRGSSGSTDLSGSSAARETDQRPLLTSPSEQAVEVKLRSESVDIVICVHNALESVRACIESVLRCTMPPYRIIVVDDGSAPETASYLDAQVREQGILLFRHEKAKGYTFAANAGLRAVTAPWVVLLNSDTVVSSGWLDRMWAHGARDPSVGVIGPLSNTASWQSVPRIFEGEDWAGNPLPAGVSVDEIGNLVASRSLGAVPMPFINGFCYMIRSALLKSVGLFDETSFGAGYGEENDFSIRVRKAGWSLVVATDAYVYHAQSLSYQSHRRLKLVKQSDELLQKKYDPERDIWPQVAECHDSLAMVSVRARLYGALRSRELIREGRARFEGARVAFILPIAEHGGGANVIFQESNALQRMGVDVTILNLEELQLCMSSSSGFDSLRVRTFASPEAITSHLLHEQNRYDAVIATLYRSVYWLPSHAGFNLGYYVQDFEPYFFPEHTAEHKTALLSYSYSDNIRLLTKTLWNQKEVARHTGRRATLLGPSVEIMDFAPGPSRKVGSPVRIAAMVRPSTPRRAPGRTISILERIARRIGKSVRITIFGSSDDELESAGLRRSWAANAGRLDRSKMAALLAEADIFLDCSDYQAMGLTALEAMLSGCAVIASQNGGCNDFIRNGVNGILMDSTNEIAYVDTVLRLIEDEQRLKTIRIRAVRDAGLYIPERAALRLLSAMLNG